MKIIIAILYAVSFALFSFTDFNETSPDKLLSLQLLHIAGESPKVFTSGWVFGVKGILHPGTPFSEDVSEKIHWTGTGKFYPEYGSETHPVFDKSGVNTITVEYDIGGNTIRQSFEIFAVLPDYYACVGDNVFCIACSHGCPACPHTVSGLISSGSPTVKVRGNPAARLGDGGTHVACCGPNTFTIIEGDTEVLIDGKPAAKIGSKTRHCGGSGYITGINVYVGMQGELEKKFDISNPYGIKVEKDETNPGVFFPGERVPASVLLKMSRPPKEFDADKIIKPEGPDMTAAYSELANNLNDIMNLQGGFLTLLEEIGQFECVKRINDGLGKIGLMFSVIQVMGNIWDGKQTEALGNTVKSAGYWAVGNFGWSALKVASVGIMIFDYVINKFISEMLDERYQGYKRAYYQYYSDDSRVKRDHKKWFYVIEQIYNDSRNLNQDYQSRLEDEIGTYLSKFWDPEVSAFYLKEGGLNAELSQEDKKSIMDDYRRNVINPIVNAANVGMLAREKKKIDSDVAKQIESLSKDLNTKFPFLVKLTGPQDKIKKIKIQIGEWSGYTDDKGLWKFDATLYAYIKNGSPNQAQITLNENDIRVVNFDLKEKGVTEILFEVPQQVTLKLDYNLTEKDAETECKLTATPANLESYFRGFMGKEYIEDNIYYQWTVNGVPLNELSPPLPAYMSSRTTTFSKTGEYTIEVSLMNTCSTHPQYGKEIATAKQTLKIKKDENAVSNDKNDKEKVYVPQTGTDFDYPAGKHPVVISWLSLDNCSEDASTANFSIPRIDNGNGIYAVVSGSGFTINFSNKQGSENEILTGSGTFSHVEGRKGLYTARVSISYKCELGKDSYFSANLSGESTDFNSASTINFLLNGKYTYVFTPKKINCSSTVREVTVYIKPEVK